MIVVDVEASGLDFSKHAMVSVGAVDFEKPERRFYRECRIWQGAAFQPEALEICGFTVEQITDPNRPDPKVVIAEFIAWLKESDDRTIGGQNTSFDRDYLQSTADRAGIDWRFGYRTIDLHSVAWAQMMAKGIAVPLKDGRTALSADAIYPLVGMPTEPKPHNALTGALMEAEALSRLLWGRPLLEEFQQYPVPK